MSNEMTLIPYSDMERMANDLVNSRFFGVKSVDECMALMLIAQAEGLHPAVAVRDYHVIQGKPSLKADAMLARFQQQGGVVEWIEVTDKRVAAKFHHPKSSPTPTLIEWDDARVIQAQLGSNVMHKKYPRQMKRARVISEGVRTVYPACTNGLYVPEEVEDMVPQVKPADAKVKEPEPAPVVKPTMRETEAQGSVVRSLEPPAEPEAAEQDKKINGTPLRSDKPTNNYPCPPDLDGTDITGEVAYLHRGDPHREVMLTAKKPVTRKKASDLTDIEVAQFFKLLIWRWGAWVQKAKTPEEGDKSRGACLDELAAVLEADYERKKLESDADQYATALPKAPAKVD